MLTLAAAIALGVLIIMERKEKLSLDRFGSSAVLMLLSAAAIGLSVFEVTGAVMTIIDSITDFSKHNHGVSAVIYGSKVSAVIRLVIAGILSLPMLIAAIYILTEMIRKPLERREFERDEAFGARRSLRHANLSILAAGIMGAVTLVAFLLTIPHWKELVETVIVMNPVAILFLTIITLGFAIGPIAVFMVLDNAAIITIFLVGSAAAAVLYVYSAAFGTAAAVRAYKSGRINKMEAVICGVLSFLPIWSIMPSIWLKARVK